VRQAPAEHEHQHRRQQPIAHRQSKIASCTHRRARRIVSPV
jgi:hypothetical protein